MNPGSFSVCFRSFVFYVIFLTSLIPISFILWTAQIMRPSSTGHYFRLWSRFLNYMLWKICRVRIQRTGQPPDHFLPAVLIANHTGPWETVGFSSLIKTDYVYVVKKQLISWKYLFFSMGLRALRPIPVSRDHNAGDFKIMTDESRKRFASSLQVLIFPEGTREPASKSVEMSPSGLLLAKKLLCSVQLIFINSEVWSCGTYFKDYGLIRPGVIHVHFGPLIPAETVSSKKIKELHSIQTGFFQEMISHTPSSD
ncbi:MAG: 1-acyl-sn-glycerol-3-phosphate acyltransferase [Candidatus Aureabacteria bacterium]|nr:1-acyl-sn-glycerol-3-phosphate acyltransferase [Candidatus Auribacterota bacterium]